MKSKEERLSNMRLAWKPRRETKYPALRLPPIAENADDLEAIKKALEDAASVSGLLWLSYLFVMSYVALAAAGVTHLDLLLETPVELPFLYNIKLPLRAFFILAPIILVLNHAYTMAHFVMLADKTKRFDRELQEQIKDGVEEATEIRDRLRQQLPSNIFVQLLAGPVNLRGGAFGGLLKVIAWTTLVIAPILLLLLLQLQFLAYHGSAITSVVRIALAADIGLIWWLWRKILSGRDDLERASLWTKWDARALGGFASLAVFVFSWFVATFPGEWQAWPSATAFVFGKYIPGKAPTATWHLPTGEPWPTNRLQVPKLNVSKVVDWKGRHFEQAYFYAANFGDIDLSGAHFEGAFLIFPKLRGAKLYDAHLQGATLFSADLAGASLDGAHLQGAWLLMAKLEGATLNRAELQGAQIEYANLPAVEFISARLEGASLRRTDLRGAVFYESQLQGASLDEASLQGVWFVSSNLQGASLRKALAWRSNWVVAPEQVDSITFEGVNWEPVKWERGEARPWTQRDYDELRQTIEEAYPETSFSRLRQTIEQAYPRESAGDESDNRKPALELIAHLDCKTVGKSFGPCDPTAPELPYARLWRERLEKASVNEPSNKKALAEVLGGLVCSGGRDAIHVLRGIMTEAFDENYKLSRSMSRLAATAPEAPALIDHIISKDCPVSAALTREDKDALLEIKQQAQAKTAKPKSEPAPSPPAIENPKN